MTNLDKIKELTAEELADWIYNTVDDFPPPGAMNPGGITVKRAGARSAWWTG